MKLRIVPSSLLFALVFMLFSCAPASKRPYVSPSGYHGFSGPVSSVKSGNRFRVGGMSGDIKLFGVKLPKGKAAQDAAKFQLYNLLHGQEVVCMIMPISGEKNTTTAYCSATQDEGWGMPAVSPYMINNKFAEIDCVEIRKVFGEDSDCWF